MLYFIKVMHYLIKDLLKKDIIHKIFKIFALIDSIRGPISILTKYRCISASVFNTYTYKRYLSFLRQYRHLEKLKYRDSV